LKKINIDEFVEILSQAYENWQAPVITLMSNKGATPFEVLVSTVLSLRTKDEVTAAASARLFERARTPRQILALDEEELKQLIYPVGFYITKAQRLKQISTILLDRYDGHVPDALDTLLELPGVGRKTANLVLIEGFGKEGVCVDTHVHRISNRIGYVKTTHPDKTEFALRKKLPRKHWIRYNELLVAFGQVICRPISPFCSRCPVVKMCRQVGVDRTR
jgi:endonuclease-3